MNFNDPNHWMKTIYVMGYDIYVIPILSTVMSVVVNHVINLKLKEKYRKIEKEIGLAWNFFREFMIKPLIKDHNLVYKRYVIVELEIKKN